ncbi:hypothetical protein BD770DRAFT_314465 [Pilaira anomala]|nr:hypothetical protein BD770DRAFT_314465 [Pilaira anomala]
MSECNRVRSDGVSFLATKCTSLNTLLLAYQAGVTNGAIQLFLSNCHYLKHVDVSGCRLLTDHAFFPLLDGMDDDIIPIILETLNISGLDLLSAHSIHQLLTRLPRLQELSLGVTYDLDEADRILDAVNTDQLNFYIDIEKYYTICRLPTTTSRLKKRRLLSLPSNTHTHTNTTTTTTTTINHNSEIITEANNHTTISLPSTSTWTLPPSIFQLE